MIGSVASTSSLHSSSQVEASPTQQQSVQAHLPKVCLIRGPCTWMSLIIIAMQVERAIVLLLFAAGFT